MRNKSKLVFGVGINDADYSVAAICDGRQVMCLFYRKWKDMLRRCYSEEYQSKHPTYKGCTVCEGWLNFTAFKAWMSGQPWQERNIDKDLLIDGNKIYSAETCVFIDEATNKLLSDSGAKRGEWPVGVSFHRMSDRFRAECSENGKTKHIGLFDTPEEAHNEYLNFKSRMIVQSALRQPDPRVYKALRKKAIEILL